MHSGIQLQSLYKCLHLCRFRDEVRVDKILVREGSGWGGFLRWVLRGDCDGKSRRMEVMGRVTKDRRGEMDVEILAGDRQSQSQSRRRRRTENLGRNF